jgi:tRNA(fMet)-specific endonuclease VapC
MKWMLDTDTCIAIIKGKPACVLKKLRGKTVGQVGISSVTLGELASEIASFDAEAAASYGQVRAWLEKRGTSIGPLDTLIGAHATALDVTLVTHNTREFSRIDTLRVEDWTDS